MVSVGSNKDATTIYNAVTDLRIILTFINPVTASSE
jgi:hypothetical protein